MKEGIRAFSAAFALALVAFSAHRCVMQSQSPVSSEWGFFIPEPEHRGELISARASSALSILYESVRIVNREGSLADAAWFSRARAASPSLARLQLSWLSAINPKDTLELCARYPTEYDLIAKEIVTELAKHDQRSALDLVRGIGFDGRERDKTLWEAENMDGPRLSWRHLVESSEKAANDALDLRNSLLKHIASEDVEAFSQLIEGIKDEDFKLLGVRALVSQWVKVDHESAREWINDIDGESLRTEALWSFALHASRIVPTEVAATLSSLPLNLRKLHTVGEIATNWAESDPHGAISWVSQNASGKTEEFLLEGLAEASSSPAALVSAALSHEVMELHPRFARTVLRKWIGSDPESFEHWVEEQPSEMEVIIQKARAMEIGATDFENGSLPLSDWEVGEFDVTSDIAEGIAEKDPESALSWYINTASAPDSTVAFGILQSLGDQNPISSVHALQRLDPALLGTDKREFLLDSNLPKWFFSDSSSMNAWVDTLGSGPFRDAVMTSMSKFYSRHSEYDEALEFAARIENLDRRDVAAASAVAELGPARAGRMLEAAGLSPVNE